VKSQISCENSGCGGGGSVKKAEIEQKEFFPLS